MECLQHKPTYAMHPVHWRNFKVAPEPSHAVIALTAIYQKVPEGYIGFVEELPGANTQAATLPEARANLREAVELVLQASRELTERELAGAEVIRESLDVSA